MKESTSPCPDAGTKMPRCRECFYGIADILAAQGFQHCAVHAFIRDFHMFVTVPIGPGVSVRKKYGIPYHGLNFMVQGCHVTRRVTRDEHKSHVDTADVSGDDVLTIKLRDAYSVDYRIIKDEQGILIQQECAYKSDE